MTNPPGVPEEWLQAEVPPLPELGADRAVVVDEFARTIYGRAPEDERPLGVDLQTREEGVFGGAGDRLRHRVTIACPYGDLALDTLTHVPAGATDAPVVVALHFKDTGDTIASWPYAKILAAGYAVTTVDYQQIEPDDPAPKHGVRGLFPEATWGAVAAWAWGLSRLLDTALTVPGIGPAGAVALGHSRLGKAALWASAQDERFAVTVANGSGCCGATLFRHPAGEDVSAITSKFPHWFVPSFATYVGRESELPVDQHQLLASIAPRGVYLTDAASDDWADPLGEYLSLRAAQPAFPPGGIGYHLRAGGHDLTENDWLPALEFARNLGKP
ncbi:hypothetical protein [Kribbella sp. NPDC048915]|uniref:glucuronyl esterase domain-containing protein n=1 Tax=Kribbella sp. NPDC048915 TaxID=3155148 RepID=UPI003409DE83